MKKSRIIVVVGPNASGKSDFGVRLAKKMNGEIISADSRQVYKGLDIGSGKVTKKEMAGIPHHCIDIADPKKVFSAMDFKNCAERAIADILSRRKTPIIVGGTGFYIDAALGRMKLGGVPPDPKLRRKLSKYSAVKLLETLKKLDPERAKTVEQKNPVRLIRAIEIAKHEKTNAPSSLILAQPAPGSEGFAHFRSSLRSETMPKMAKNPLRGPLVFSKILEAKNGPRENLAQRDGGDLPAGRQGRAILQRENMRVFEREHSSPKITWLGIKRPPEVLKKRIHARLLKRLPGIIKETKKLHNNGVSWKRLFELGLEYRYASLHLRGKLTKEEMISQLEMVIWHYAKRQMTWFKKNKDIKWIKSASSISL
ncbi:MAG: tRNA (adenosine(37)-N6)-dimethylallyltransferase MiaA [bacterium]|nr:tRNA (adenosine(37)-N6)-dimethylallyltransferase MiaA [bacterium]